MKINWNAPGKALMKEFESVTGKTAARQEGQKERATAAEEVEEAKAKSTGLGEALAGKREELTSKRSDLTPKAEVEKIDRSQVRDVTAPGGVSQVTAPTLERQAKVGPAVGTEIATAPQGQVRDVQSSLIQALQSKVAGTAQPSAAQLELQKQTERNIAQQAAARAGVSGIGSALARREAARTGAELGQQLAGQSAQLQAAEQQAAEQQLGQLAQGVRTQDIDLAQSQAQLQQQTQLANLQAELQQQGLSAQEAATQAKLIQQSDLANQQAQLAQADQSLKAQLANQGVDLDVLKQNAAAGNQAALSNLSAELQKMGMNDAMIQSYLAAETGLLAGQQQTALGQQQLLSQEKAARQQAQSQMLGAGVEALGTLGAAAIQFSDKNLKKNIKQPKKLDELYEALEAYDYDYKPGTDTEPGTHSSVMAQDLEKSELGKRAIMDTEEGKMVDYSKLLPAMFAEQVMNRKKISSLEEALTKKLKKGGK